MKQLKKLMVMTIPSDFKEFDSKGKIIDNICVSALPVGKSGAVLNKV